MNSMQLKAKLKSIALEKNVDFNTVFRAYMYDRFIERLSVSKYRNNFILKGGFYLSALFGLENRTTMDIDTSFRNANFDEDTIIKMIKNIITIDIKDNATLTFLGIETIREEDEYGEFRITIQVEIENIKEKFHIDIATGDPITPREIIYKYKPILGDTLINLMAYNLETVIAEKLETLFNRAELNGRMRDFYDLYYIYVKEWNNINVDYFRKAIDNTFSKRGYKGTLIDEIETIKNSELLKERWEIYKGKYAYTQNIEFDEIIECLYNMISLLTLETI